MNTSEPGRDPVAPGPESASASASTSAPASASASASAAPSPELSAPEPEGRAQSHAGQGARLRAAREAAGLSIEAVGARLRLAERQVAALEADDYAALPPGPFVRGFVRNYARLLGLDPQEFEPPVVRADPAIPAVTAPQVGLARPQRAIRLETGRTSANRRWLVAAGVALLLGAVGSWVRFEHFGEAGDLFARHAEPQLARLGSLAGAAPAPASAAATGAVSAATQPAQMAPRAAPAAMPIAPPPAPSTAGPSAGTLGASPPTQDAAPTLAQSTAPTAASTAAQAAAPTVRPAVTTPLTPSPALQAKAQRPTVSVALSAAAKSATRKLQLEFDADSWVEVRDDTGKVLLSGMSRAGDRRDVEAHGPVRIVVGNAPKTRLSFDGHPVDLAEFTRMTVARLTIDPAAENPATPPVTPAAEAH